MALNPKEIATAIILCKRASLRGEEALAAVQAISALEREYNRLTRPQAAAPTLVEGEEPDKESDERTATDRQSPAGA